MSFLAKLFINGRAINVLDTNIEFYQQIDPDSFKPAALPRGGVFSLTLEADGVTDLLGLALSPDTMCEGYIRFYRRDGMSKLVDYEFFDTYIVNYQREFTAFNDKSAIDRFVLSPGILRIGDMVFEKWWKVTDLEREKVEATPVPLVLGPKLSSIKWKNIDGATIEETTYGQKVALEVAVANPDGGSVEITIEKEDGTEFENGQKTLSFTEYLTEEGTAQLNTLKIKNEWEEFKVADVDGLVAKVSHKGTGKTSSALQLVPPPKVIVDFRPHKNWKGEFGFDWLRVEDTKIDGDVVYEKNVGEYGNKYATQTGAVFTVKKFKELEKLYNPENINGRKDSSGNLIKYYTPWLNIYREPGAKVAPEAKLELLADVDHEPEEIYLEFKKDFFDVAGAKESPEDPNLKRVVLPAGFITKTKKGKPNKTTITLKCVSTFLSDETIKVWSTKNKPDGTPDTPILSGRLKVKANNKSERRISKIVFVNVRTKINATIKDGITMANKTVQENYLSPFLKQALVMPEIANENFDLFDGTIKVVKKLNKDYTLSRGRAKVFHKYSNSGGDSLVVFLNKQFDSNPAFSKYKDYYKVFFLGEDGGRMNGVQYVGLGGHANGIPSKECIMYASPMKFFVAHELMHCMGLYHSFDNKGLHTFKIGQTENIMDYSHISSYASPNGALTQISTWKWQWDILKNSNEKEV